MTKNIELLSKAMDRILENPQNHDQTAWIARKYDEAGGICGTTMCLAGHVAVQAGAQMPNPLDLDWDGAWYLDKHGKMRSYHEIWNEDEDYTNPDGIREVAFWAADQLGLTYEEREYLFFYFGDADGLKKRVANVIQAWEKGEDFVPSWEDVED
jgi:hypothetical protein